jgi:hypothetical protein
MFQSIVIMGGTVAIAVGIGRMVASVLAVRQEHQQELLRVATLRREEWIS